LQIPIGELYPIRLERNSFIDFAVQMTLNDFPLLVAGVGSNGALVAEGNELNKVVEPFAHGCGVVDTPSEFRFAQEVAPKTLTKEKNIRGKRE
jgi:hypothetical protein